MTKQEKKDFCMDLTNSILASTLNFIDNDQVPERWNGHELRQYLADRFDNAVYSMDRKTKKEYANDCLINNL